MIEVKACAQEGCDIRKDGKCLEGLDAECPHFYLEVGDEVDEDEILKNDDISSVINKPTNKIKVFEGSELGLSEVSYITQRFPCELVVILGDLDCGKTTLLATIFDLFQIGQFKKYLFAGSFTQKGFEKRSHLSRMSSGAVKADTERTKALDFRILHLTIKDIESLVKKHFLLSDISGETIQIARGSGSAMKEQLGIVKFANHIIYIIDGEKLAGADKVGAVQDALVFIQSALDNRIFNERTVLNILISKWDLLEKLTSFDLCEEVENKINARFSGKLNEITYRKIASRPEEEDTTIVDLGFGLQDLISDFMMENSLLKKIHIQAEDSDRFINNYKINLNEK